ncbi:glycerate kinase family protein [Salinithrix halophila]|uniref:glycerate kinase family protein n=1 Tax=Salinithrix halophila TaxID=1485204 RepID=UPI0036D2E096
MKILVAPDSFKGSMTSTEAGQAIQKGIRRVLPHAVIEQVALADGGEGTVDAFLAVQGGKKIIRRVTGPLGDPVESILGVLPGGTIVMEAAAASGLPLIPEEKRNPWVATSRGTGELLRAALDLKPKEILIGLGGSAVVDGGIGFLQALGGRILDKDGREVLLGGQALEQVFQIDLSRLDSRLWETRIIAAVDVDNPLLGPAGAARIFGPQKGADPGMVERLERGMENYARLLGTAVGSDVGTQAGGGAAGGLGAALVAACGALLQSGFNLLADRIHLEQKIATADLIITGEGQIDSQSLRGKAPVGVGRLAVRYRTPAIAFTGFIGEGAHRLEEEGIQAVYTLVPGPVPLKEAQKRGAEFLTESVSRFFRGIVAVCENRNCGIKESSGEREGREG